jgi:hypothetical protein
MKLKGPFQPTQGDINACYGFQILHWWIKEPSNHWRIWEDTNHKFWVRNTLRKVGVVNGPFDTFEAAYVVLVLTS